MKGLGERIKELRKEYGYTQPEFAKKIGVSNAVVSYWENNLNEPKATYIKVIAECFNVSTDYLLGLEDETGAKIKQSTYNNYGIHIGDNNQ